MHKSVYWFHFRLEINTKECVQPINIDISAPAEIFIVVSYTREEGKEDTKARELDGN